MEDISRELEKEIAQSRPKPYKKDRKKSILIVDDFGTMKSGEYLKTLVKIFLVISMVSLLAVGLLYTRYKGLSRDSRDLKERLAAAENEVAKAAREKEMLMAKLVISGKEPGILEEDVVGETQKGSYVDEKIKLPLAPEKKDETQAPLENKLKKNDAESPDKTIETESSQPSKIDPDKSGSNKNGMDKISPDSIDPGEMIKKTVALENFMVTKDRKKKDLLVRFDIRNISKDPGDVEGRVFILLKPEDGLDDQWLVVPASTLLNGVPSEYRKGQYFSIAHFKPVKFRIKNQSEPDFFTKASIFIFNEQGDLILEKLIEITEAE